MSIQWWRSWHGAPTDHKWAVIAARSGVKTGVVSAIGWALLDYASQQKERGSVAGFDPEEYAVYSGFSQDEINSVLRAMEDKGILKDGKFVNWEKRQPKREDDSAERVARHGELKRGVTQSNAENESETFSSVSVSLSDSSSDSSKDIDSSLAEDGEIQKLSRQFEASTNLQPRRLDEWTKALQEMYHAGVTPEALAHVIHRMKNPAKGEKKLTVSGPWSCVNLAIAYVAEGKTPKNNSLGINRDDYVQ